MGTDNQVFWKLPVDDSDFLLIVGASARAAAFSALRAGLRPWCIDLFGDADLRSRCPVQVISLRKYPHGLIDFFRQAPPGSWMYTGALENHPRLVERLTRERPLWGNPAKVLRRVRSPMEVARVLKASGLPCPEVRMSAADLPRNKRWLIKPLAGAGGAGIGFWNGENANRQRVYFQEFIEGTGCSAVFLSALSTMSEQPGEQTRVLSTEYSVLSIRLLGVTEQLIGETWLNAKPFHWCGNVGPIPISAKLREQLEALGAVLAREFGLRGLFGVDFILKVDCPWPVEINPRYTGAVEVLEYASGQAVLGEPAPVRGRSLAAAMVGKAILFAKQDFRFPDDGPWMDMLRSPAPIEDLQAFADIPLRGTDIEAGQPVLTMFTRANTVDQCREQLRTIALKLEKSFYS